MSLNKEAIEAAIKARIVEIAAETGDDASELGLSLIHISEPTRPY